MSRLARGFAFFACLSLAAACGDAFPRPGGEGIPRDGSVADMPDASLDADLFADAASADTAGPQAPPEDTDALPARDGTLSGSIIGMGGCYDDADLACDPDTCGAVRSCCVGSGSCCGPSPAPAPSFTVPAGCVDFDDAETCIGAGVTAFGFPQPYVLGGAIVPGGDGSGDSGLLSDGTIDLTVHQLALSGRFRKPSACGSSCFETAALGVTTQSDVPGAVRVVAALVFSASRSRMALIVGESQVKYWDGVSDDEEWTLELRPSGELVVMRAGAIAPGIEDVSYAPRRDARVALYGHSVNPASMERPTAIEGVTVDVSLCDVPDSWADRAPLRVSLAAGGMLAPRSGATAPSLLRTSSVDLLLWEQDGAIWLAEDDGSGFRAQDAALLTEAMMSWVDGGVGDPELVEKPDGTGYALFFTARTSAGAESIGRLDLDTSLEPSGEPTQVVTGLDVVSEDVSEPTIAIHESGTWVMVVRTNDDGRQHLRVLRSDDGGVSFARHFTAALDGLTARTGERTGGGFDEDEISDPSLVIHNGAWQLHYVGRRGIRSGVGLLVSDDLVYWRNPTPGAPVLEPGESDDEQVAVAAPDVVAESFGLSIVYVADDGYRGRLYRASRLATDVGTF